MIIKQEAFYLLAELLIQENKTSGEKQMVLVLPIQKRVSTNEKIIIIMSREKSFHLIFFLPAHPKTKPLYTTSSNHAKTLI